MTRAFASGLLIAALCSVISAPISAQSPLEQVERLTRLGRADEARTALMEWWDTDRRDASRRDLQRGMWLRGRLTVDPVQAELDFQRLAVLYPTGQFTPDAILRLAQASWAMGDEAAARTYIASLRRDYPRSDAREAADEWLADAGPVPEPGDTPTPAVAPAVVREAENVDDPVAGLPRPDRGPDVVPDSAAEEGGREEAAGADEDEAAAEPVMNYYVQLGAFADEERAFALFEEVQAEGVDVRVVRVDGSRFTHVRVGRFAAREDAVERLEELTEQGISGALVRDDRTEEPVRE